MVVNTPCRYCKYPLTTGEYVCQPTDSSACTPCRKVAELDEKLRRMREAVVELEEERQQWKVQVNANHDKLTSRLPPELVAAVLNSCLPDNIATCNLQYFPSIHTLGVPLVLSAVSQRWRDITHSTPQMWADVPLRLVLSNYRSLPALAKDWIERSGQCPLSISIFVGEDPSARIIKQAPELIKVVNHYSSRWTYLKYDGISSLLSNFSSQTTGISQLQTLSLKTGLSKGPGVFDLGGFIVQPKCLILESVFFLKSLNIHYNNITELVIKSFMCFNDSLELLRRAPHLTKCTLSLSREIFFSNFQLPQEPILLRDLLNFKLNGYYCYDIFTHVLCPSLETLTVEDSFDDAERALVWPMVNFMQKSSCSVTTLCLRRIALLQDDITILCQGVPTLRHLHIELLKPVASQLDDHIFNLLAKVSDVFGEIEPQYLPALQSLSIYQQDALNLILLPAIFSTPLSSKRHRHELKSVEIIIGQDPTAAPTTEMEIGKDVEEQLLSLKNQGVSLRIQVGQEVLERRLHGIAVESGVVAN